VKPAQVGYPVERYILATFLNGIKHVKNNLLQVQEILLNGRVSYMGSRTADNFWQVIYGIPYFSPLDIDNDRQAKLRFMPCIVTRLSASFRHLNTL
jgi:hypothetical protein